MIRCGAENRDEILAYIGKDYGKCLYLYVDLMKYGFDNPNVRLWLQKDEEGNNRVLVLQYYTGMHVFSREGSFDASEVRALIEENAPSMICGMRDTLALLGDDVPGYELETGKVGHLEEVRREADPRCVKASREDLRDIADLMADDEALGKPYQQDLLYRQLVERYDQGFGRSFMIRDEEKGNVIATASTYAEEAGVAVVSGVMVHPEHRGQGLAGKVLTALCTDLRKDNMDVFSYYYIEQAERLHRNTGFESVGAWAKLVRQ